MTITPISTQPIIAPSQNAGVRASRAAATPEPHAADAAAWGDLSDEERNFFAQARNLGPVSYGRGGAVAPRTDVPLGQNIDVRG